MFLSFIIRRRPILALLPALALASGLLLTGMAQPQAQAQSPAAKVSPPPVTMNKAAAQRALQNAGGDISVKELEALAQSLRDDGTRGQFLTTLDRLIAAKRTVAGKGQIATTSFSDRAAAAVSGRVAALGTRMASVLGVLRNAPALIPWLEGQVSVAAKRDRLIGLIWRFLAIVGLGMGVQFVFRKLTTGARRRLETMPEDEAMAARAFRFTGRTVMLYLNALAYAVGAYGAYVALPLAGPAAAVLLVGASSFFVAKLILATTRVFLSPGIPGLRPGGMGDETAHYLYIWARRLVRIFVYAFFLLEAMRLVGLPAPAHESLVYLTGLMLAGFLVVFVLQNRVSVAAAIRGGDGDSLAGGARARFAGIWHLAAITYIAAVYLVGLFEVEDGFEFLLMATCWSVLALIAAKVIIVAANRGLDRMIKISGDMAARFPGLEQRANRYMPVLRAIVSWAAYLIALLIVLDVWGVDTFDWLASNEGRLLIEKALTIFLIVFAGLVIWEMINASLARYVAKLNSAGKDSARALTLLPLMRSTAMIILILLVTLIVLSELGVNIGPLLAGAGVLGLAVGFGSQKLVQDIINGVFILVEDTLAVGDVVKFNADHAGVVEALSIRTVKLRDLAGNVHTLPFSEVTTILNMTKDWSYYVFDVGIGYRENVDHVIGVLREIDEDLRSDEKFNQFIAAPLDVLGLDQFADSAVIIKARLKVCPPIKQWAVGREFNRRMKARFDAEGIEIPFPHQTLYFGEDRDGNAPPLRVKST
jgi:moderate conductance mechanosensitive channel